MEPSYIEPHVRYDLAHGAGNDPYDGPMDRFGRVTDLLWYDYGSSADLLRFKHGYDRAGNRLYREEADTSDLDQLYSYDDVNRLVQAEEGTLSAGKDSISSLNFKQEWSLDPTGNWSAFKEDLDGDTTWDLEQTRTSSAVNEITDVAETTGPSWISPAYNRAGNMTTIPQPADPTQSYAATYDAWNRLVKLEEGEDTVAHYVFDGARRLVVRKKYVSGSLSQTRHFYHTPRWQTIEERLESGGNILSTADRQFTWGRRYIDDLVCRTLNSVHDYAYQDPNWNVILSSSALARVVSEPYGQIRSTCPAASGDLDAWQHYFAGYRRDEDTGLYLVRHRVYQPELGCWVQRDPIGLIQSGPNAYCYVLANPHAFVDPSGAILLPYPPLDTHPIFEDELIAAIAMLPDLPHGEASGSDCRSFMEKIESLESLRIGDFRCFKMQAKYSLFMKDEPGESGTKDFAQAMLDEYNRDKECFVGMYFGQSGGGEAKWELQDFKELFSQIRGSELGPLFAIYACRPGNYHALMDPATLLEGRSDSTDKGSLSTSLSHFNAEQNWKAMKEHLMKRCDQCCRIGKRVTITFVFGDKEKSWPTLYEIRKALASADKPKTRKELQFDSWPGVKDSQKD